MPKDGPSAGVTMATAIASLVRGEPVADDVGMTGEITLTGQVLPIGGLREKSLAAQRAGLKRVIFPRENEPDLDELPPETREALEFIPADTIEDVFAAAFAGKRRGARAARAGDRARRPAKPAGEAREQLLAGVVGASTTLRRQSSWYSRVPAQHERVLVDVIADRHVVAVRADAAGRDGRRGSRRCRPSGCATAAIRAVELAARRGRRARPVGLEQREGRDLDELGAVRRGRPARRAHDLPARRRLES